jgi:hypothetical protein
MAFPLASLFFAEFGHAVFANSIRVSFLVAILAIPLGEPSPREKHSPIVGFGACGCNIWRTKVVVDV